MPPPGEMYDPEGNLIEIIEPIEVNHRALSIIGLVVLIIMSILAYSLYKIMKGKSKSKPSIK